MTQWARAGVVSRAVAVMLAGTVSLALLSACGSENPARGGADGGADAASVTFTEVYRAVLTSCTSCHAGILGRFDGLDMGTQATAYTNLVGVHASGNCSGTLVVRGSSATSLLYQKVTSPPCGSLMPQNAPPLPKASIDLLKTWIDEGAPDN